MIYIHKYHSIYKIIVCACVTDVYITTYVAKYKSDFVDMGITL